MKSNMPSRVVGSVAERLPRGRRGRRRNALGTLLLSLTAVRGAAGLASVFDPPLLLPAGPFESVLSPIDTALAADGTRAIVGWRYAVCPDDPTEVCGAALIFVRGASGWALEASLSDATHQVSEDFGRSVALSSDGATVLVGIPSKVFGPGRQGVVQAFSRHGSSWTLDAEFAAAAGCQFVGAAEALSADGNLAVLGAGQGAVYVARRVAGSWGPIASILPGSGCPPAGGPGLGGGVGVSAAGDVIVQTDSAYTTEVFRLQAGVWALDADLPLAGQSVAIAGDGDALVVGSTVDGRAYSFLRRGGSWQQEAPIGPADSAPSDLFGGAVRLSSDDSRLLVTAPADAGHGVAYVFERGDLGDWSEAQRIAAPSPTPLGVGDFGVAAALSGDGATAVVTDAEPGEGWVLAGVPAAVIPALGTWGAGAALTLTAAAGVALLRLRRRGRGGGRARREATSDRLRGTAVDPTHG